MLSSIQKEKHISVRFKRKEIGRIYYSAGDAFKYAPRGIGPKDIVSLYESVQDILDELEGPSYINWEV